MLIDVELVCGGGLLLLEGGREAWSMDGREGEGFCVHCAEYD